MPRGEGVRSVKVSTVLAGHGKTEEEHRQDICIVGRWMYEHEYIVGGEGNVSVRLADGRILTTPTCMNKGCLSPEDLVITDLDGHKCIGERRMSSEILIHLRFLRLRPDGNAVCHAQPITATGSGSAHRA